ncbi:MAG: L-histidine N(alpha)-methyltransferase [Candidatus Anammoxibacter sp.]
MQLSYIDLTQNNFDNSNIHELALQVLEGLSQEPKSISSSFFYDQKGSEIFQQITELDEYYLTNCEFDILNNQKKSIADIFINEPFNFIELGSGDGKKTFVLLEEFTKQRLDFKYIPIDISKDAMESLFTKIRNNLNGNGLVVEGLVGDYFDGMKELIKHTKRRNFVLFLGSSIGNFNKAEAEKFLRQLWYTLNPGDYVLIGFDLKKDLNVLHKAYNDSKGVTSEFNLNLLTRLNNTLGADFDRSAFLHQGIYDVQLGAMESFLISTKEQTVKIDALDKEFSFKPWEGIHTEYSYKYTQSEIETLAADTGYDVANHLYDSKRYFIDSIWQVKKEN